MAIELKMGERYVQRLTRGDSFVLPLYIDDTASESYDFTGVSVKCYLRNNQHQLTYIVTDITITPGINYCNILLKISPDKTQQFEAGVLYSDVELTFIDGTVLTVLHFEIKVMEDQTHD